MSRTRLEQEFIDDHQKLTKAFQRTIDAVQKNDAQQMSSAADTLDQVAGPHMAFEESILYPQVGADRGDEFRIKLLQEHQVARQAITALTSNEDVPLRDTDRARVLEQLRIGLDHAISCGSLLSHITVSSEERQAEMLEELRQLRRKAVRWTELGTVREV